jgi:hypothetical protein
MRAGFAPAYGFDFPFRDSKCDVNFRQSEGEKGEGSCKVSPTAHSVAAASRAA